MIYLYRFIFRKLLKTVFVYIFFLFFQIESVTFKASAFPKSAVDRHMSLQERKQAMLETARRQYKEKHGIP